MHTHAPGYASKAIRITPHSCVDVHADSKAVVLGFVGARINVDIHGAPKYARRIAAALIAAADYCDAARKG